MKILIAEDSKRIRRMLKDMVSTLFADIFECSDGQKAIELYSQNKPDWTLMDIEMPLMYGLTATRKIMKSNPEAKVMIVTSYDNKSFRKDAMDAGATKYILKENLSVIYDL